MTRRTRSIFKAAFALSVLALILITLGFFPQDFLRQYVERRIQTALGPGSRIRRHARRPRTPDHARSTTSSSRARPIACARRARGWCSPPGFLWGQALSFRAVEIERPTLEVWPGPPGKPTQAAGPAAGHPRPAGERRIDRLPARGAGHVRHPQPRPRRRHRRRERSRSGPAGARGGASRVHFRSARCPGSSASRRRSTSPSIRSRERSPTRACASPVRWAARAT